MGEYLGMRMKFQGPRNNFKDIETPAILRNRLLAKAEFIRLPGFQIFLNIVPFSMKSNYSPNFDPLLGMARVFFFIHKKILKLTLDALVVRGAATADGSKKSWLL